MIPETFSLFKAMLIKKIALICFSEDHRVTAINLIFALHQTNKLKRPGHRK